MLVVLERGPQALATLPAALLDTLLGAEADEIAAERLVAAASAMIARHCNRTFGRERVREKIWPGRNSGACAVSLTRTPVRAVHGVIVDGIGLAPADFEADEAAGLLYRLDSRGAGRPWHAYKVEVDYTGGYALPGSPDRDLPEDVEQACLTLVSALAAARDRDPLLRSETTAGVGSTSWLEPRAGSEALPPQVAGLLASWRRIALA